MPMAHRFYVPQDNVVEGRILFSDEQRKQIKNVLRLSPGDTVNAFDGSGREYTARLGAIADSVTGEITDIFTPQTEPALKLTLVQSLPKGEKLEFILQKCTEIGVHRFILIETARSIPKIPSHKLSSRLERWRSIAKEAAEQSGRVMVPTVEGILTLNEVLPKCRNGMIAWENETGHSILNEFRRCEGCDEATLFIGPEGGFSAEEIERAERNGVRPVSLGSRILRTETAAVVGSALLIYAGA